MARMRDFQDDMSEKGRKLRPTNQEAVEKEIVSDKTFEEQMSDLQKEISNLPEDKQGTAQTILNSYAERTNRVNTVANEIDDYIKNNPDFDPLFITRRPEGLSYEAYRVLGRAAKKSIKQYLKRR